MFVYELLLFLKFHRRWTSFYVLQDVHSCVMLHLDLAVCAVLLHARGCPKMIKVMRNSLAGYSLSNDR